jgi:hydroxymethylpyrimidine/phosphomethylpyrimidine kinase
MSAAPARPAIAAARRDVAAGHDVLICAGLDPSGGAGLIADIRVVTELGGRPVGVVTALTVQNTTAAVAVEPVAPALLREQLEFLLSDVEVRAVKIGMLGTSEIAGAIAGALALTAAPVVWDPVIVPSRGAVRLVEGSLDGAIAALAPHAELVTPNVPELELLTGARIASLDDASAVGRALAVRLGCAVLVKGGHLGAEAMRYDASSPLYGAAAPATGRAGELAADGALAAPLGVSEDASGEVVDVLCFEAGCELLRGPRVAAGEHVHGTGCALSSAIAAYLARGAELVEACRAAKAYVASRIASPVRPGRGAAAVL